MNYLTTKAAAALMGITPRAVVALIERKRLPAVKHGRDWMITEKDVAEFVKLPPGPKPKRREGK